MNWLGENKLPFVRLFSKIDKLKIHDIKISNEHHNTELLNYWERTPPFINFSSKNKIGRLDILKKLKNIIS